MEIQYELTCIIRIICYQFTMSSETPVQTVGAQLLRAAKEFERSPGELLTEMFPYIFEASKRMSTRAISRWLEETHGIKISQPTISRALQSPDKYWQGFAEFIDPAARIAADAAGQDIKTVLLDESLLEHLVKVPELSGETQEELADNYQELGEAVTFLKDNWFALGKPLRNMCSKYFSNEEEETK